jgi:cation diffusion facilitator family transporter
MDKGQENIRVQKYVAAVAVILFLVKIIAYFLTHSISILTDALESIVNVIAGFVGLYSLHVSARPKDVDHPYGHGKAEFLSAAVEGTLITVAGLIIIYESIKNLIFPPQIRKLDFGILLISVTAVVNFLMGYFTVRIGRKNNSLALIASGKHLQSDTYSTLGIIGGLILIFFTGYVALDSIVAIVFALIIIYTGYRIIRSSIAGIMDEADNVLLSQMVQLINKNRRENWVDIHNLRVIKYGGQLHVDCHLTVPWFLNVKQAHDEVEALSSLIKKEFGNTLELFVHTDPCLDCDTRMRPFQEQTPWTLENMIEDKKHKTI